MIADCFISENAGFCVAFMEEVNLPLCRLEWHHLRAYLKDADVLTLKRVFKSKFS